MKTAPSLSFAPLGRDSLVNQVASALTDAILTGGLPLGAHLSESVIARDMGLSRAPVREAARLMESAGLLVSHPNRGFFVRTITADALETLYELRACVEIGAAARLVRVGPENIIDLLNAQIAAMGALSDRGDTLAHIEADMQFHRLICAHSGNDRFLTIFDRIATEIRLSVMLIGHLYDDTAQVAQTHAPIVAAIAARDAPQVQAALQFHLDDARSRVVALVHQLETGSPL